MEMTCVLQFVKKTKNRSSQGSSLATKFAAPKHVGYSLRHVLYLATSSSHSSL